MHNLLFCVHTLCMNYVTNTFLLVSSSVSSKQLLCFVHGQGQKSEQKPTTKNFVEFHNHSPLLTMVLAMISDPPFAAVSARSAGDIVSLCKLQMSTLQTDWKFQLIVPFRVRLCPFADFSNPV